MALTTFALDAQPLFSLFFFGWKDAQTFNKSQKKEEEASLPLFCSRILQL